MTRSRLLLLILIAAPSLAGAQGQGDKSHGQKMSRSRLQALLPTTNLGSTAEQANNYVRQRITPFGDPKLYFEIPVSKDWDSRPLEAAADARAEDDKSLVPLALITPNKQTAGVGLEVQYLRVPERATLERFLESYPEQAGFTLLGRQDGEYNGRVVLDRRRECTGEGIRQGEEDLRGRDHRL